MTDRVDFLLWIAVPYAAFAVFVTGHFWRYRRDQLGWSARSTQLLERRLLRWGSLSFHLGMLAVLAGHVGGILVPASVTRALWIDDGVYHAMSATGGILFGAAMTFGFGVLVYRRTRKPRVAATTTRTDVLTYVVLGVAIVSGMLATAGANVFGSGYEYRDTVAPWFRGLGLLSPDPGLMSGAPLLFQVHAMSTVALFALWPFSRLVHAWSVPVAFWSAHRSCTGAGSRGGACPAHRATSATATSTRRRPARHRDRRRGADSHPKHARHRPHIPLKRGSHSVTRARRLELAMKTPEGHERDDSATDGPARAGRGPAQRAADRRVGA